MTTADHDPERDAPDEDAAGDTATADADDRDVDDTATTAPDDRDDAHLQDVDPGAGCTEIWEHLSDARED